MLDLKRYRVVVFDLDGTVYEGPQLIPGAAGVIELLRVRGVETVFLTNNSACSSASIAGRLRGMGVPCDVGEVWTACDAAAQYLAANGLDDVHVCGTEQLRGSVERRGIRVVPPGQARCLLVGYDMEATYADCADAVEAALAADVFIACNKERRYPGRDGRELPGCGAMVAAVEWCAQRKADVVIGKPYAAMLETVMHHRECRPHEVLMVGDTPESDIEMARCCGCDSLLVGESGQTGSIRMTDLLKRLAE